MEINFKINGEKRTVDVAPHEILLDVLRTKMALKSPKCGCDRGDCGACSVLIDGKSVRSCLILAVEVDGCDIRTVEGLSEKSISKVQEAFIDRRAFQCGFCTPGMLIAATDLLSKNPDPTREEVKEAMGGQLCRCTGYKPIIDAVCSCAKSFKGDAKKNKAPAPKKTSRRRK